MIACTGLQDLMHRPLQDLIQHLGRRRLRDLMGLRDLRELGQR